MNPCELNVLITAITNHLYTTLSREDFARVNVFVSELGKSMFSMALYRDICYWEDKHKDKGKDKHT